MKKFKLFLFLLVLPSFALPQLKGDWGIRVLNFSPSDEAFKDIYGSGLMFGITFLASYEKYWASELAIDYFSKDGTPYTYVEGFELIDASCSIKIIPITWTVKNYFVLQKTYGVYWGAGLGYYPIKESVSATLYDPWYDEYYTLSEEASENFWGYHLVFGYDAKLVTGGAFTLELKWSTASKEIDYGYYTAEVDVGGFSISAGYRFTF